MWNNVKAIVVDFRNMTLKKEVIKEMFFPAALDTWKSENWYFTRVIKFCKHEKTLEWLLAEDLKPDAIQFRIKMLEKKQVEEDFKW